MRRQPFPPEPAVPPQNKWIAWTVGLLVTALMMLGVPILLPKEEILCIFTIFLGIPAGLVAGCWCKAWLDDLLPEHEEWSLECERVRNQEGYELRTHRFPCRWQQQARMLEDSVALWVTLEEGGVKSLTFPVSKIKWEKSQSGNAEAQFPEAGFAGSDILFGESVIIYDPSF